VSVGIGTATPYNDYGLTINTTNSNSVINGGVVVNASGGNLYLGMTNGTHMFRVDTKGVAYADGGFQSSGADFAESVAVRGHRSEYQAGDLLEIARGANRRLAFSQTPYSTRVAGIYSTKPGVLATPHSIDAKLDGEVPLAIVGIVPCKVTTENGTIHEGDLLVSSSRPGYAMKGTDRRRMLGAVVGKALEPLPKGKSKGVIEVLVTLQ
jgi:trimeric autotransporter adhesin